MGFGLVDDDECMQKIGYLCTLFNVNNSTRK